jgi:3-keto steroid reductase
MTLTLVLVCRSEAKGRRTRDLLLKEHERLLQDRARKGMRVQEGWWDGLKIEIQTCDQSSLEGDNGVINFCERLKKT